jgi:hypothetical protein
MRAVSIAQQHLAQINRDDDDNRLKLDTIEGQSDAFEVLDRIIENALADQLLAATASERAKRLNKRAEKKRELIVRMLDALGLTGETLERPIATIWVQYHREVTLTGDVPDDYLRSAPDMRLIKKDLAAGKEVENATLGNAQPSLHILPR